MTINCLPTDGNDIKAGFHCSVNWTGGAGTSDNIVLVPDGQGGNMYIDTAWSGADMFVCFFIFVFLILKITEVVFSFFLPKITRIRKK